MKFSNPQLQRYCEKIFRPFKLIWALPRLRAIATEQRRRQKVSAAREVERLDRIRNPSKYRGK